MRPENQDRDGENSALGWGKGLWASPRFPHGLPSIGATQRRLENNLRSMSMENVCFISSVKHADPGAGAHSISSLQGWSAMAGHRYVGPDNYSHLSH